MAIVTSVPLDPTSILNSQRGFRAAPVQAGFMEQVLFLITLSYNGKIGLVPAPAASDVLVPIYQPLAAHLK